MALTPHPAPFWAGPPRDERIGTMATTTQTTNGMAKMNEQYAIDQWAEIADRAVQNGQSENEFILSCHIANRPAALKAYRAAKIRTKR
jgi:hypothetical protein